MVKNKLMCEHEAINENTVSEIRGKMPPAEDFYMLANLYKMFSDATRLKILWALHCGEMCVCDLAALLGATKSAVSHQLKQLRLSNLVRFRREGKAVYYSLADDHVKDIFEKGFAHIHE